MNVRPIVIFAMALLGAACQTASPIPPPSPAATSTAEPAIGVSFVTLAPPTPFIEQTTPTPLPPPTVTPSPTPIIYLIDDGDTILAIALANNTTTAEILTLNPGVRPELLQIGQQIILPPPAPPLLSGTAATPIPLQIKIEQVQLYPTRSGTTWLIGEVVNQAGSWAENVRLSVTMLSSDGADLGQADTWIAPNLIPPGEKAPFGLLWPGVLPPGARPVIAISDGRGLAAPGIGTDTRYVDFAVVDVQLNTEAAGLEVSGRVVNTGARPAGPIILVATLYNSEDLITGYFQLQLPAPLLAGDSSPFAMTAAPPGGGAVRATFNVQGLGQ